MELIAVPKELILRTIASLNLEISKHIEKHNMSEAAKLSDLIEEYLKLLYPTIERL